MERVMTSIPTRCALLAAIFVLASAPRAPRARVVERIVAVVNDSILLQSELEERMRPLMPQLEQMPNQQIRKQRLEQLRRQMLEHMINEELIRHQANKLKIKVEEKDLERAVADVMKKNNLTREQLEAALRREGKSIEAYKESILRPQLLRLRVLNVQVRSRVSVSEDEVRALYQKNLRALGVEAKVRARHIFIAIPGGASSADVVQRRYHARRLASQVRAKVKAGVDFGELARKHSEDSVTRADGGDLGYFGRGTLPANVESVVFSMKKGEIKGPIRTERGFHIIELTDKRASSARSLDQVRDELHNQLYSEKMEKATKAWLADLRKRSYVDIKIY